MFGPGRWGLYDPQAERDGCGVGFVAQIGGERSREIVDQALEVLSRMGHRGACGCDPDTGDGAGILINLPHRFFKREGLRLGFRMPRRRRYGVGFVFLPPDPQQRARCKEIIEQVIAEEGQQVLGWRDVPVDPAHAGPTARAVMPVIRQVFIGMRRLPPTAFERTLYVIRKLSSNRIRAEGAGGGYYHVASLSSETMVYKGLLLPEKLPQFYLDLQEPDMVSAVGVVHSRFSTNTFPTWDLAQPFRYIAHNGEINTLNGNRNWLTARRSQLSSAKFGGTLERLFPIIVPGKSDSAQFDNMLELLRLGGRTLSHSMMVMIPEAWENDTQMTPLLRDFYQYFSALMEPWDGPAAIVFASGGVVGATLDRNGLRPARYWVTTDDRVVLASEAGVLDLPPEKIRSKGRLRPGKMFIVDIEEGRILDDEEVKRDKAGRFPYGKWLKKNIFDLERVPEAQAAPNIEGQGLTQLQRGFGYSEEDLRLILGPMATGGMEPTGSMGVDTPLAVLSDRAPTLFNYFHQLFAQVTNPPIDPIRESLVMTLMTFLGPEGNTFDETPEQCHQLRLEGPILTNDELVCITALHEGAFEPRVLSLLYEVGTGPEGLAQALASLNRRAEEAIDDGCNILVLSDRGVDARNASIPSLLAVSAVHQYLVREGIRMQAGLVLETGEAREVHDFAVLIGFGAAAVNPYLAFDSVVDMVRREQIPGSSEEACKRYIKAVEKGLLKIMAKMGISTLHSYRGAQIFEAVGLNRELVEEHFTNTPSRIEGIGLYELGQEVLDRHHRGFGPGEDLKDVLPVGGHYAWRRRGDRHQWNPATIAKLQAAVVQNSPELFREYAELLREEDRALNTLRGALAIDYDSMASVPLDEVESARDIAKRFVTGAMSFGSISAEAHETLAIAMNRLGAKSNSGEGGEEARRFVAEENGDLRRSAIKQIASGRFGVTTHYLVNADELQIKIAQGAKPGEGGQLPGYKVDERIARVRNSTAGVTLISPPPHHDIYSIEDLAQLIYDLQAVNPQARIGVKLVSEFGVGTVAAGVAKAHAGCIIVSGYEGGTGASPLSSIQHAGLPWELGLAETQQVLVQNRLRDRVRVQVDGGLRGPRDVVVAALLGAEEFGLATAALVTVGCVLLRKCHQNACSVGIATQDPELRARFAGKPEHVVNFFLLLAEEVRRDMARLGYRRFDDMVGQVERLRPAHRVRHWKAEKVDLAMLLAVPPEGPRHHEAYQPWPQENHLDYTLKQQAESALDGGPAVMLHSRVDNSCRAVGTVLSGEIARRHGARGLSRDAVRVQMLGAAGQSFGAFLAPGLSLELWGEANDYVGKGMAGGRIVITPPPGSRFPAEDNVIAGNTALYGATGGELFICGEAGERFAVRNSGARAVVEGVGDHCCEYMTGGVVIVLGSTGRNFAAGMSGGTAYVFDRDNSFRDCCNTQSVELEEITDESDLWLVHSLIQDHVACTDSALGKRILDNWDLLTRSFVKVVSPEYRKAMQARRTDRKVRITADRLAVLEGGA